MRSGLRDAHVAVTSAQPPQRTRSTRPLPGKWPGAGSVWAPGTAKILLTISGFLLRLHTLGEGPRVGGEGAGGMAEKLSGEPCTNKALHQVQ